MAFVDINPRYRDLCQRRQVLSAQQFLALPGALVSGHPDRNVARVRLGSVRCFLKREHRVRWQERLVNLWAGAGFVSRSVREARLLHALQRAGVPAPEWIAAGEDDRGRAFLLVRELDETTELRTVLRTSAGQKERRDWARAIGVALAHMHDTGFTHPDLYAKHVHLNPADGAVYLLDWQRGRRSGCAGWPERWRDLAALHATLADDLAAPRDRLACLRAYLKATLPIAAPRRFRRAAIRAIVRRAEHLQRHRHIRELRHTAAADSAHRVIWLDGEALCVTPRAFAAWPEETPAWLRERADAPAPLERSVVSAPGAAEATLVRRRASWSLATLWKWLWERRLSAPEVRQAGLIFRLQRYGVATPQLLAFGQRHFPPWRTESFLLTESNGGVPVLDWLRDSSNEADRRQVVHGVGMLLRRLHEAGCAVAKEQQWPLAVQEHVDGTLTVGLGTIEGIVARRQATPRDHQREVALLRDALRGAGCSSSELHLVSQGYQASLDATDTLTHCPGRAAS